MNDIGRQDELGFPLPAPASVSRGKVVVVLGLFIGGAFAYGMLRRSGSSAPVGSGESTTVHVEVIKPTVLPNKRSFELPGVIKPLEETAIYPRATGYVRKWLVDIGDKVTAGQVLAEIDVPDLEAQLAQAHAQLSQAQAALKQAIAQRDYSKTNAARYGELARQEMVSKAQGELTGTQARTDEANVAAARANVAAQAANVRRLTESQGFAKVVAPFAGTITMRGIDRGTLVTEGKTTAMFNLVAIDPVRVFVDVPQSVAPSVTAGVEATLTTREYGGRTFKGSVTRSAGALDPDLHTMTTEIQAPNPDGALMPGMYAKVTVSLPAPHQTLEIPATALYSDDAGLRVAVVDAQHKIHFAKITVDRDTGATLQVSAGLTPTDKILKIAVPTLAEGDLVDSYEAPPPAAGSAAPAKK